MGDDAVAGGPLAQHAVAGGVSIAVRGRSVVGWRFCRHGVDGFVVAGGVVVVGMVVLLLVGGAAGMALVL